MKQEELIKQLREAQKTVQLAIKWIDGSMVTEEEEPFEVGTCVACGKPIYSNQDTTREVHRECYNSLNNKYVRTKQKTWDDLYQEGKVGPPRKPGRKPKH